MSQIRQILGTLAPKIVDSRTIVVCASKALSCHCQLMTEQWPIALVVTLGLLIDVGCNQIGKTRLLNPLVNRLVKTHQLMGDRIGVSTRRSVD